MPAGGPGRTARGPARRALQVDFQLFGLLIPRRRSRGAGPPVRRRGWAGDAPVRQVLLGQERFGEDRLEQGLLSGFELAREGRVRHDGRKVSQQVVVAGSADSILECVMEALPHG